MKADMRTLTKNVVTRIAYMIGVRDDVLEKNYGQDSPEILEEIRSSEEARIIRILNIVRSMMMQKYSKIDSALRYELKNLDSIDVFDHDDIKWLEKNNVHLLQVNTTLDKYLIKVNQLITTHINDCKNLIPEWITWEYVKGLFVIPGCMASNSDAVLKLLREERRIYMTNIMFYPFQLYIHWKPADYGNVFNTDRKFLTILYQMHHQEFYDNNKVMDANEGIKDNIYNFIEDSDAAAIVVDCENSDVYKLYSVLENLNQDELAKIKKIILYDDYHTNNAWKLLERLTHIPTERIEVERVTEAKSLVDIKMTAGVCKEYYENNIQSFILVSSDSDFWGLISSLPQADFLVMIEYDKCGMNIKRVLRENNIYYCSIDDFNTGNISEIKTLALRTALRDIVNEFNTTGIWPDMDHKSLVDNIYRSCRIEPTPTERRTFVDKYIRTLKFEINKDGQFNIVMK